MRGSRMNFQMYRAPAAIRTRRRMIDAAQPDGTLEALKSV